MLIECYGKFFELVDEICRNRESTALNLIVDLGNSDAELLLEIVAGLGLLLVIRDIILAKDISGDGLFNIVDAYSRENR